MSYSRINTALGSGAGGGGGGGLTDAQTAALSSVSLGDITDFTANLYNYWPLGIPAGQETGGTYECTTYNPTAAGLVMTCATANTVVEGTNASSSVGFYRMCHASDIDVAIDIDSIANVPDGTGNKWHVTLALCIGGTDRKSSMFAARLEQVGGGSPSWSAARVISPSHSEKWDGNGGAVASTSLGGEPSSIRLRVQHSVANTGFKAYYSTNGGASYTTLEEAGADGGGTGWYQMHTRDGAPSNGGVGMGQYSYANADRYKIGGSVFALVTVGQNVDKTVASDQGQCRVTFKDLS